MRLPVIRIVSEYGATKGATTVIPGSPGDPAFKEANHEEHENGYGV